MTAAFEMTLEYLKTRKQFGVPIGSFQALKHRAAQHVHRDRAGALGRDGRARARSTTGADEARSRRWRALAKARCSDAFVLVGNEGVQMHGGIGMTDEHDIGFFLKRARGPPR